MTPLDWLNASKLKSLKNFMLQYNPKYAVRVSSKDFGYNPDTRIKSIPLYAAFLIIEEKR